MSEFEFFNNSICPTLVRSFKHAAQVDMLTPNFCRKNCHKINSWWTVSTLDVVFRLRLSSMVVSIEIFKSILFMSLCFFDNICWFISRSCYETEQIKTNSQVNFCCHYCTANFLPSNSKKARRFESILCGTDGIIQNIIVREMPF